MRMTNIGHDWADRKMSKRLVCCVWVLVALVVSNRASAHSLWLASENSAAGREAIAYFGESPSDRTYHWPDRWQQLDVALRDGGQQKSLKTVIRDEAEFVGRRGTDALPARGTIETQVRYGVYHGTLLNYVAKHVWANRREDPRAKDAEPLSLEIVLVEAGGPGTVVLQIVRQATPLAKAQANLYLPSGERREIVADERGRITLNEIPAGLLGVSVSDKRDGEVGVWNSESYQSVTNIATMTIEMPAKEGRQIVSQAARQELPVAISSFGAAVCDGYLYVYGGHQGKAHDHSRDNLHAQFLRIPLARIGQRDGAWEELPMETPVQGLAMVSYAGRVYRIGGMTAKNRAGDDEQLYSVDDFSCFDPSSLQWRSLPPLPQSRSSHDAVVIGDRLYVAGGWSLMGNSDGKWHDTICTIRMGEEGAQGEKSAQWRSIRAPGLMRRAVAAGQLGGKLVVIGGIDNSGAVSREVNVYDPAKEEWTMVASLPGEGMNGFGVSAWNLDGRLLAGGSDGVIYALAAVDSDWHTAGHCAESRFFHRMLPMSERSLLILGGASRSGHLRSMEHISWLESDLSGN
ncbi:MAG: kelch repeat-containing protein [Pirellulaceae bacterium]|nr:hypothetical protein [Planctomycetales bacterium]